MTEEKRRNPPFHSMSFSLIQNKLGRKALRLKECEDGYELHVEKGSASNPSMQFTRVVPVETAQKLKDALGQLGVFSWGENYGDTSAPGSMKWSLNTVFKEGVFTVSSKGGSDAPKEFADMLEEFYRLDFPRPAEKAAAPLRAGHGLEGILSSTGVGGLDMAQLASSLPPEVMEQLSQITSSDALDMMTELRRNPQAMQQRMKEEFSHMSAEEQNAMIDALAQTGLATRAFWEQFFRGL